MGFFGKLFGGESKKRETGMEQSREHHSPASTSTLEKDPVCGMDVDPNKAAARSEYQVKTYYFCAPGCKSQFDKDPVRYISGQGNNGHSQKRSCCQ